MKITNQPVDGLLHQRNTAACHFKPTTNNTSIAQTQEENKTQKNSHTEALTQHPARS
jgi:hypothetical protein